MAYSRRPLFPCVLLLALVTTACAGPAQRKSTFTAPPLPKSSKSATPAPSGSAATTQPGSSAGTSGTPKPGASASTGTGSTSGTPKPGTSSAPSTSAKPKRPVSDLKITMTLSKNCVMQGQSQTVDLDISMGDVAVLIDTLYEDKKDGQTHGGFKIDGRADSKGHYSYTFTVLPSAPKGGATVFVRAGNAEHRGEAQRGFIVGVAC